MYKNAIVIILILLAANVVAQHKISFDLAAIRNMRLQINGSNISCFYHFNEHLVAGAEVNRFYPLKKTAEEGVNESSAWDFDYNMHYLIPLNKKLVFYPLTGFSHTSEKEMNTVTKESVYERFWSFNTGAGFLYECGRWAPHIEYSFTWGHLNQQFLLAGISYELEWGKAGKEHK
jgi:hypothetical protein